MRKFFVVPLCMAALPSAAQQIDPNFGIDSTCVLPGPSPGYTMNAWDMLVHPDGRIWVIGDGQGHALIYGLTPQGAMDSSFATYGVYQRPGGLTQTYQDAEFAPGGTEVYVMGTLKTLSDYTTIGVDRLTANGTLSTWHGSGTRTVDISNCDGTKGYAMMVRSDGRLLLAGRCDEGFAFSAIAVAAISATGTNDYSLNGTMQFVRQLNGSNESIKDLAFDINGGLVLGVSEDGYGTALRLDATGVQDMTWNGNGYANVPLACRRVRRLPTWRLLFLGYKTIVRLLSGGADDTSYGPAGVLTPTHPNGDIMFHDWTTDANGRILISGTVEDRPMLMRLGSDGDVDSTFGTNGMVLAPWDHANYGWTNVAVDAEGGILLSFSRYVSGVSTEEVCRFLPDVSTNAPSTTARNTALRAWPNPASDVCYVENVPTGSPITVHDAMGRPVLQDMATTQGRAQLTVDALPPGIYTVRAGKEAVRFLRSAR